MTKFIPAEASFINNIGKGAIEGQAFLRRNDGVVVYAAGSEVKLIPATAYAEERMTAIYGAAKIAYWNAGFKNDDQSYYQYMKTTIADGEGKFAFKEIADGSYFVVTTVTWMAGNVPQGGTLMERVTISGGSMQQVILRGL